MMQWWDCSPPTNVSWVQFPDPASYGGWVFCWFSTLLWEVFLRVLTGFPLSSKNQYFQIPIWFGMHKHFWTSTYELLGVLWVNRLHIFIQLHFKFTLFDNVWPINRLRLKAYSTVPWNISIAQYIRLFRNVCFRYILNYSSKCKSVLVVQRNQLVFHIDFHIRWQQHLPSGMQKVIPCLLWMGSLWLWKRSFMW